MALHDALIGARGRALRLGTWSGLFGGSLAPILCAALAMSSCVSGVKSIKCVMSLPY